MYLKTGGYFSSLKRVKRIHCKGEEKMMTIKGTGEKSELLHKSFGLQSKTHLPGSKPPGTQ